MEITLMRHGQPTMTQWRGAEKITASEMLAWIAGYDASDVTGMPDLSAKSACDDRHFVVSSPLQRARSSLIRLGTQPDVIVDDLREAPLPMITLPWLRLSPHTWLIVFRLFWLLGFAAGVESRAEVRKRAKHVACDLTALAGQHERVFSMGHGFMNKLIAVELARRGWQKTQCTDSGYWGWVTYALPVV